MCNVAVLGPLSSPAGKTALCGWDPERELKMT